MPTITRFKLVSLDDKDLACWEIALQCDDMGDFMHAMDAPMELKTHLKDAVSGFQVLKYPRVDFLNEAHSLVLHVLGRPTPGKEFYYLPNSVLSFLTEDLGYSCVPKQGAPHSKLVVKTAAALLAADQARGCFPDPVNCIQRATEFEKALLK